MRRLLLILLGIFLIGDALLALFLFSPSLLNRSSERSITIATSLPKIKAELINKLYLDKKLDEAGFWQTNKVWDYGMSTFVTVSKLEINLTDQEQKYGKVKAYYSKWITLYSFGQKYDPTSQTMRLNIHTDPILKTEDPVDYGFSANILASIFDITHISKYKNNAEREIMIKNYLKKPAYGSQIEPFISLKQI